MRILYYNGPEGPERRLMVGIPPFPCPPVAHRELWRDVGRVLLVTSDGEVV
jgi:hypothetical protein